jgi:hypothetical protein
VEGRRTRGLRATAHARPTGSLVTVVVSASASGVVDGDADLGGVRAGIVHAGLGGLGGRCTSESDRARQRRSGTGDSTMVEGAPKLGRRHTERRRAEAP